MSFSLPNTENDLEKVKIELNSRQNALLTKYKIDNVITIEQKFKELLDVDIDYDVRDELLANAELEVKALVEFARTGGFAREFIYLNNNLNVAYELICAALNDPKMRTIPWAEMIADIINGNYGQFMELVIMHEKDLKHMAQHIQQIVDGIKMGLKSIITTAFGIIKDLLEKTLELVQTYAIPMSLIAIPISAACGALIVRFFPGFASRLALMLPAFANPVGICVLTCIATVSALSATVGIVECKKAYRKSKKDKYCVERIGLRNSLDCIQALMRAIEDKKNSVYDRKAYNDMDLKLCSFKREIEDLISRRI